VPKARGNDILQPKLSFTFGRQQRHSSSIDVYNQKKIENWEFGRYFPPTN
jgi:hypothetical protein